MRTYKAVIKERSNEHLLTPTYTGINVTRAQLIEHWGLNEPDVEWYKLYDVTDGKEEICIEHWGLNEPGVEWVRLYDITDGKEEI